MSEDKLNRMLLDAALLDKRSDVKYCLHMKADIEARDEHGMTALAIASMCNYHELAEYLIEEGADVNARDVDNEKPVDLTQSEEMLIRLINAGAYPTSAEFYKKYKDHYIPEIQHHCDIALMITEDKDKFYALCKNTIENAKNHKDSQELADITFIDDFEKDINNGDVASSSSVAKR